MDKIFTLSALFYCLFTFFVYNQQRHARQFNGESQVTLFALNIFVTAGMITNLVYLSFLWYRTHWYIAFSVLILGIFFVGSFGYKLEKVIGHFTISMAGFIGLPIFGALMFYFLTDGIQH